MVNKQYKDAIVNDSLLLDETAIIQELSPLAKQLFPKLFIVASVDSTNKVIKDFRSPCILLAEEQTRGRGRYDRFWHSPFAAGIYLSLLLPRSNFKCEIDGLSLAVGVMVLRFLNQPQLQLTVKIKLKWPNDLLASLNPLAKLGGILVEASDEAVIIGIGINYYQQETDMASITTIETLRQESGVINVPQRSNTCPALINQLAQGMEQFYAQGFKIFRNEWNAHNILSGLEISVDDGKNTHSGVCQGADNTGRLLLQLPTNGTMKIASGTIIL